MNCERRRWWWGLVVLVGLMPGFSFSVVAQDDAEKKEAKEGAAEKDAKDPKNPVVEISPSAPSEIEALLTAPKTIDQFWLVLDRELNYGKPELAKRYLTQLLENPDLTPAKLVELREKYGSSMLVKLERHPELGQPARDLIAKANEAAFAQARDPARIEHFIGNLSKTPGERGYAIQQLRKAGPYAIPYFVVALKANTDRDSVLAGLAAMNEACWPAVVALLDSNDPELMSLAIETLLALKVRKAADSLWYYAYSPRYPEPFRIQARGVIAALLATSVDRLGNPVKMLNGVAEQAYQSILTSKDGGSNELWFWKDGNVHPATFAAVDAVELIGMKAAQQALDLDPRDKTAKVTLLSLGLDMGVHRVGIEQSTPMNTVLPMGMMNPKGVAETGLAAGQEILSAVLERALAEHRTTVVIGAIRLLAQNGNRSLIDPVRGQPGLLMRAFDYPDNRVPFAAAMAILQIHPTQPFAKNERVVQTLIRALAADRQAVAMVLDSIEIRGNRMASAMSRLGYSTRVFREGRTGFNGAVQSAGVDMVIIDPNIQNWRITETIANFKADTRTSGVPLVLFASGEDRDRLDGFTRRYPSLAILPWSDDEKKLESALKLTFGETVNQPLTPAEKLAQRQQAMEWIIRLAGGEMPYFDVRPASDALANLLFDPAMGQPAAIALSYLASGENQQRLGQGLVDTRMPPANRPFLARALALNIQIAGRPMLDSSLQATITQAYDSADDPALRPELARLVGLMRPETDQIADRLRRMAPPTADVAKEGADSSPAAETPEKKPEMEEEKPAKEAPAEEEGAGGKKPKKRPMFGDDEEK